MGWKDHLHFGLAQALGLHHEDPVVQQLTGLRRVGGMVYELDDEMRNVGDEQPQARARAYYGAAQVLVTFADAFVLDAFLDPDHPKHVPHVTFLQAAHFYRQVPDLVNAVRRELAYPGSGRTPLPVLPGPRFEAEGRCPIEHLLAMQRAAEKTEELLGTRIELLEGAVGHADKIKTAVLMMTDARTKKSSADLILGAIRRGERVPNETHEQAEGFFYDGVLRTYLYAAQELALPGVTASAPRTEDEDEAPEPNPRRIVQLAPDGGQPGYQPGRSGGMGLGNGGLNWGTLITADIVGNLVGDLLGGMFGGGNNNWF